MQRVAGIEQPVELLVGHQGNSVWGRRINDKERDNLHSIQAPNVYTKGLDSGDALNVEEVPEPLPRSRGQR